MIGTRGRVSAYLRRTVYNGDVYDDSLEHNSRRRGIKVVLVKVSSIVRDSGREIPSYIG